LFGSLKLWEQGGLSSILVIKLVSSLGRNIIEASAMTTTIEDRLAKVEHEVDQLKAAIRSSELKRGWLARLSGSRREDPVFDEIVRLGKEIRDAEVNPSQE
jgi:hypothetical protein